MNIDMRPIEAWSGYWRIASLLSCGRLVWGTQICLLTTFKTLNGAQRVLNALSEVALETGLDVWSENEEILEIEVEKSRRQEKSSNTVLRSFPFPGYP